MKKVYEWFGGRRYFFSEQVLLLATGLLCIDKINSDNWVTVILWTLGIYVGGNVYQKFIEAKKGKNE